MPGYRCFFLDQNGCINRAVALSAPDDISAVDQASILLKTNKYSGVELWQDKRIVHVEGGLPPTLD